MTAQLPTDAPPTGADTDLVEPQPAVAESGAADERADNKNQRRGLRGPRALRDRKSTRLNSSHT